MKHGLIFALLLFLAKPSFAFSLDNSDIKLFCPQRGQIEVILHRYEHTQESWDKDQFETGGGHSRKGPLLMIEFANLDQMIYNQASGVFSYWYAEQRRLVQCRLLSMTNLFPVDIPYYHE